MSMLSGWTSGWSWGERWLHRHDIGLEDITIEFNKSMNSLTVTVGRDKSVRVVGAAAVAVNIDRRIYANFICCFVCFMVCMRTDCADSFMSVIQLQAKHRVIVGDDVWWVAGG